MTPTPDIEPIREGLADSLKAKFRAKIEATSGLTFEETEVSMPKDETWIEYADACLTYLIKRQAFLYDVYERIIAEKGLGK